MKKIIPSHIRLWPRRPTLILFLAIIASYFLSPYRQLAAQTIPDSKEPTEMFAGDVAIIGYNAGPNTQFSFLLLENIASGTTIRFTDSGWTDDFGLGASEGVFNWTAPRDMCAGNVVVIERSTVEMTAGQDQILAYQRPEDGQINFLYGLNSVTGDLGWQVDGLSDNHSAIPIGLAEGETAISLGGPPFAIYNGPKTGTKASLLTAIANNNNWLTSADQPQILPFTSFMVTDASPCEICNISLGQTYDFVGGFSAEIVSLGRFVSLRCVEVAFQPQQHPSGDRDVRYTLDPLHWKVTTKPPNAIGFQAHVTLNSMRPVTDRDRICQLIATAPVQWECVLPTGFFEDEITLRNFSQFYDLSIGRTANPVEEVEETRWDENPQFLWAFLAISGFGLLVLLVILIWLMNQNRYRGR
ncbi:MAG: hypothetical protein QNJ45_06095 [Ardenticatenaceae bacterium]|nr:hypothetical protein [Ardenticatenaceae bacterium]